MLINYIIWKFKGFKRLCIFTIQIFAFSLTLLIKQNENQSILQLAMHWVNVSKF